MTRAVLASGIRSAKRQQVPHLQFCEVRMQSVAFFMPFKIMLPNDGGKQFFKKSDKQMEERGV